MTLYEAKKKKTKSKKTLQRPSLEEKPEHWREQAISCGPSTAMQAHREASGLSNCSEIGSKSRMLHFKTRTHPAVSAREARSIRTALRKRYGASFVTAQIEECATMCTKPAVSFLQLQATPLCAYARTPSPCQMNGTYVRTSLH